ncbi:Type II toxin-antitoxin system HicA family toxin [Edwardsiella anguillarum]|uniref:Uncharacterized protein n=2 Tax=Edwardsiella anguillarum TaxID=1821960 RepID=A0A076LT71_9GAMM|nr:Hypothetical protein ETEE_3284 [Edwardsiella anguillarum ET080813]AKM48177.1 hypothetical protein QY76_13355 [Edwardsiella sp. EA181011]KAB0592656.1 hypothetical protein F7P84_04775 [Edwardsiella anguillarum]GAJ66607.1 hypothetical protein MA13_contig00002-0320 [Edwardsiella piscicida]RFT04006.1 hypothetical protein CGL57_09775 [Edwardsiella anguillarum]
MRISSENIMSYLIRCVESGQFKKVTFSTYKRDRWISVVNMPMSQSYRITEQGFHPQELTVQGRDALYAVVKRAIRHEFSTNKTANFIRI